MASRGVPWASCRAWTSSPRWRERIRDSRKPMPTEVLWPTRFMDQPRAPWPAPSINPRDRNHYVRGGRSTMNATLTRKMETQLILHARTAADLMVPNPISLRAEAAVAEAAVLFTEKGITAAPVIDEAGRPIGVVSR